jgi:hypothetical protein
MFGYTLVLDDASTVHGQTRTYDAALTALTDAVKREATASGNHPMPLRGFIGWPEAHGCDQFDVQDLVLMARGLPLNEPNRDGLCTTAAPMAGSGSWINL